MCQLFRFFIVLMAVVLVGCGSALPTIKPYKMDIQQGNVLTSEMLLQLRPGMTKSQVRFILGTPLLVDSFHSNRWDYFYQLRKQGEIVNQRRVILDFENDLLVRVRGDVVPKGQTAEDVTKQLEAEVEAEAAAKKEVKPEDEAKPDAGVAIIAPIEDPNVEVVSPPASLNPTSSSEAEIKAEESGKTTPVVKEEEMISGESEKSTEVMTKESVLKEPTAIAPIEALPEQQSNTLVPEAQEKVESVQETVVKEVETTVKPIVAIEPSASEVAKPVAPIQPATTNTDKKQVFRMDRQLDSSRINQAPKVEKVVETAPPVTQVPDETEPNVSEHDPSYFERILEKIGF